MQAHHFVLLIDSALACWAADNRVDKVFAQLVAEKHVVRAAAPLELLGIAANADPVALCRRRRRRQVRHGLRRLLIATALAELAASARLCRLVHCGSGVYGVHERRLTAPFEIKSKSID